MSGLRERLLRHKKQSGEGPGVDAAGAADGADLADVKQGEAAADGEWAQIGARMEQGEWGSFVMRRRVYDGEAMHGRYALHELIGQSDQLRAMLAPAGTKKRSSVAATDDRPSCLPHDQLLYLDTETTGLGIGAGNVPFMIGIGYYEQEQFIVEQMFIRHPGEELAMLHYLQIKLQEHPYLVSYNGKTFDWPIIKNRYILNRMPSEPDIAGHLDFLYPSRSLWKHTLPSCRLGKVEEERLNVVRHNDVPGSLAPALYFQYLAERDVSIVEGVFVHNELDILSLAGLSIHFADVLNGRSKMTEMGLEELYRLGLWLDKLDQGRLAEQALALLEERLYESESEEAADYLQPLALVYKKQQRFTEACRLWTLYVERKGDRSSASAEPFIELSMHYEHREKQLSQALYYAEQALLRARQRQALKHSYGIGSFRMGKGRGAVSPMDAKQLEEIAALEKRIQRLRHKSELADQALSSRRSSGIKRNVLKNNARKVTKKETDYMMDHLI
ncbi:ribonuclease H-like domain-containing protein [Paenibacillus radicis (ex Xue et al. 2023)]|uniref:Ribonuclease H-like domain-containing protein n=1 Tax=Paenibacillus radicis (ex Xue et al. 2023) TaxID=2972489 RepID=A0ABT1YG17_9BACL|nr:ribonuclease H-like domain-containing protein [Paenibacillus radicis (ex Xue et al. 2023)]MCR8631887.1 ribonuclease H-like domain-containing protein [Paenibacillus radicis (ex Xue et al. 2023)]